MKSLYKGYLSISDVSTTGDVRLVKRKRGVQSHSNILNLLLHAKVNEACREVEMVRNKCQYFNTDEATMEQLIEIEVSAYLKWNNSILNGQYLESWLLNGYSHFF